MNNERNQPRKRVDFFQAIVDNYLRIEHEIKNQPADISPERKGWLLHRSETLSIQIDQAAEKYLTEMITGTQILRSGHTAH